MKKQILFVAMILAVASASGQEIRALSGFDPVTGRPGYIYRDTSIPAPFTVGKYLNGYTAWGSLSDTVRTYFSGTSPISYNSSTGAFSLGTVPIANGGTNNASLSVTAGTLYYGDGTKLVGLAPGTAGQHLTGGTTPSWKDTATGGAGGGLADSAYFWQLTGNAPAFGKFFGTTTSRSLRFRTNNIQRMLIDSIGRTFIDSIYLGRGAGLNYNKLNLAIGDSTLQSNTTGTKNLAIGDSVLRALTTAANNVGVGWNALLKTTTGGTNSAFGSQALQDNTTGFDNMAMGFAALRENVSGSGNVAIGVQSLLKNSTGTNCVAIGNAAMGSGINTANGNIAIGYNTLYNNTSGQLQVAIGHEAMNSNTTGTFNTAVGRRALYVNTTGGENVSLGFSSMTTNTTGGSNVSIGTSSLFSNVDGSQNVMIGYRAGAYAAYPLNTADRLNNSVIIGYQAGSGIDSSTNQIVIGYTTEGLGSNSTTIGNLSTTGSQIMGAMKVATGTLAAAVASAQLEVTSTTKGFLPPRMTATQASAISSPAEGLMVYVTDTNGTFLAKGWWGYDGAAWQKLNN